MAFYKSLKLPSPTIIAGLGFSGGAAQLHTVPPYVPAVVLTGEFGYAHFSLLLTWIMRLRSLRRLFGR